MDRNLLETYFYSNPEVLEKNISHRFRNYSQFNTVSLANHLEINSGNTNFEKSYAVYLQPHNRGDKILVLDPIKRIYLKEYLLQDF